MKAVKLAEEVVCTWETADNGAGPLGEGGGVYGHTPDWCTDVSPTFTEHSYRGAASDATCGEVLLLNIDSPTGDQYWSLQAASGEWTASGRIASDLMRDRFFPGQALRSSLEYARAAEGALAERRTILSWTEGEAGLKPSYGRFHATPESGSLYVVAGAKSAGQYDNHILKVAPGGGPSEPLGLDDPHTTFFTATERGGSGRSSMLDLSGTGSEPNTLRYARISVDE